MSSEESARPVGPAWFAFRERGERHLGILVPGDRPDGDRAFDAGPFDESAALAVTGGLGAEDLGDRLVDATPLADLPPLDVPVARPSKILCFGKNFAAHAAEFGAEVPEEPLFFTKLVDSLLPAGRPVVLPHWLDTRIDHEIELGVVLGFDDPHGRGRKYVAEEQAMDLVAGYTVLNDVTARKMQGTDRGAQKPWLRCKSFDTFCPVGPWVVPAANLPDLADLEIGLRVGDRPRQRSELGKMVVTVARGIAWLSRHTTLRPGDLLAMGTPEGVGPIDDGDEMVGWIEGIGVLRNPVERERP